MLSFIRKRLPSRDRTNERHPIPNRIRHESQDDDQIKRTQSADELNVNNNEDKKKKKKKKKEKSLSTLNQIDNTSNSSPVTIQINQSYSDVDYFPMMPGALLRSMNHQEISPNSDSLTDCYANPLESLETINRLNYVQTKTTQPRVIEIPVIDCRKEQRVLDYKGVDHAKTNALREVTEQRIQQKLVK